MAMEEMNAIVYGRYKDDVNFVLDVGGVGETGAGEDMEQRIMERGKNLADSIHPSIQVEVDCGYNHAQRQGRLPVLDIEVWIGEAENGRLKTLHSHYMKDVSS